MKQAFTLLYFALERNKNFVNGHDGSECQKVTMYFNGFFLFTFDTFQ